MCVCVCAGAVDSCGMCATGAVQTLHAVAVMRVIKYIILKTMNTISGTFCYSEPFGGAAAYEFNSLLPHSTTKYLKLY